MKTTSFVLMLALVVGGVAHGAKKEPAAQSTALKVAKAAGFKKIRDVTAEDVQAFEAKNAAAGSPTAMAAMGVGTAAGVFSPPPGLSSGAASGLFLAGSLLSSLPVAYAENSRRLLIWMPKHLAATPEAASIVLRDEWVRAIAASLPAAHVELREREIQKKTQLKRYVWIGEAACTDCRIYSPFLEDGRIPRVGKAPDFLGSYDAYVWGRPGYRGEGNFAGYPWTVESMTPGERQEFLRKLSGNLPQWAYIYVPPDPLLAPYPQMFHQGEVLLFIEPGLEARAAAQSPGT